MRIELAVDGHPVTVRDLRPADEDGVLAVFAACEDWFTAATGQPSAPGDVQSSFYSLPEGADLDDKVLLVIDAGTEIIGFVDAVRRYPHIAAVSIGAFLIHPDFRRLGIGRAVAEALFGAAREADFAQINAHVVEGWLPGRKFLAELGFTFSAPRRPSGTGNRNPGPGEDRTVIPALIAIG
ncbi:MAG: GNAT family N-acetyltransferase [Catenulispora sp.]|nr:GNAT family N-acetyltransferase [Catenulispora sp.]